MSQTVVIPLPAGTGEGVDVASALVVTITPKPDPPPPPPPPPPPEEPEPEPEPEPPKPQFDLMALVLDGAAKPIVGAIVTPLSDDVPPAGSGPRSADGSGFVHFPVYGSTTFRFDAPGFVSSDRDLPPWDQPHRVHLERAPLPPAPIPQGAVRLESRTFVDDSGPFCAGIFTDMSALRLFEQDRTRHDRNCQEMAARGADARRILGMVGWQGREIDPRRADYLDWLIATIDAGYEFGLRTELTMFADCNVLNMAMPERRTHAQKVAHALQGRAHKLLFIEGCNEPGYTDYNGPWTPDELLEIGRIIKAELPTVLFAPGAPWGIPGTATGWTEEVYRHLALGSDLSTPHLDRDTSKHDGMYRPIRQPIEAHHMQHPFVNNEPIGPGSSIASEENAGRLRAAATFTWLARGAGYCYHTKAGIGVQSDALIADQPGASVVFDGKRVLEKDTPSFQFHNWHWTSNPWETLDGSLGDHDVHGRGSLRTISGINGGRVQTQVLRVEAGCTLRARWAMQLDVWHGGESGPYQPRPSLQIGAGQTFEVEPCVDTVMVGRFV